MPTAHLCKLLALAPIHSGLLSFAPGVQARLRHHQTLGDALRRANATAAKAAGDFAAAAAAAAFLLVFSFRFCAGDTAATTTL